MAGAKDYFANTANWYGGDTSATPRASATSRIDDDQTVGIGMEASEPAFQNLLAQLRRPGGGELLDGDHD